MYKVQTLLVDLSSHLSKVALAEHGLEPQVLAVVLPRAVRQHVGQLRVVDLKVHLHFQLD